MSYGTVEVDLFNVESPKNPNLPFIFDDNSLAFHLGIRNKTLWYLLKTKGDHYKCFNIKTKDKDGRIKKVRPIQAPLERMKAVHTVLNGIFTRIPVPENVGAYVPGKNCVATARRHINPGVLIGIDISNFFNSTRRAWVRRFLRDDMGYSHYVSSLLADLCTYTKELDQTNKDGSQKMASFLPQGSPLSGYLANLVAWHRFGSKIEDYLKSDDDAWVWSIYSDDLAISHPSEGISREKVDEVVENICNIINHSGYKVNRKKTRVLRKGQSQRILGCTVNDKLNIPRSRYLRIRSLIHNCFHHGFESQAARCDKDNGEAVIQYIRGMLEHFKQIRLDRYELLNEKFQAALTIHGKEASE